MDTLRLFLHVLSASIWVGGQIVLMGLLPTLKKISPEAPKLAAQAYNRIAWPAYGIAMITGIWNLLVTDAISHPEFEIKFLVVLLSGAGAAVHIFGNSKLALAAGGGCSFIFALVAMYLGFLL